MTTDTSNYYFQKAVAFVNNTNRSLFLTGKAGTGKTTFLKYIKEYSKKKTAIVAPTGVAAINAGGVTIHSFLQLPTGPFAPTNEPLWQELSQELNNRESLIKGLRLRSDKKRVIKELETLIIDEISMVRADLLDAVDTVLRWVRQMPHQPFGGVQVVFIGDLFQLPPVVRKEEWALLQKFYNSPFFFDAVVVKTAQLLIIELDKIYRQQDAVFIDLLNNIRNNTCTAADLELLNSRYNPNPLSQRENGVIVITSHNRKADEINSNELNKLPGKTYTYTAEVSGDFNELSVPAEKVLRLKAGAQVMFVKNDKGENRRYYNGKIGTIKWLKKEKITVVFPGEDAELELELEKWQNIQYIYNQEEDKLSEKELGSFKQFPIKLAWAITIHKSQGLTFDKAIIDAADSFAAGQVYVSISRLTNIDGLTLLSKIKPDSIRTDTRVLSFIKLKPQPGQLQEVLDQEQHQFIQFILLRSFTWGKVQEVLAEHASSYVGRQIPDKEIHAAWAQLLASAADEQAVVAEKFKHQLTCLFSTCTTDNYKKLNERVIAATAHFTVQITTLFIEPVTHKIDTVKTLQRVKKYIKDLKEIKLAFESMLLGYNKALQLVAALQQAKHTDDILKMMYEKNEQIQKK